MGWAQLWAHQQDAFACFAGHQPLPQHCGERAWLPVVEYSLFYGLNVFSSMWVVKEVDAIFCPLVGAFFVPGVAIASAIPAVLVLFGVSADEVIPGEHLCRAFLSAKGQGQREACRGSLACLTNVCGAMTLKAHKMSFATP